LAKPPLYRFNWFITLYRLEHVLRGHRYNVEPIPDLILKEAQGVLEEIPTISDLVCENFRVSE
jgi:hypothetical protein